MPLTNQASQLSLVLAANLALAQKPPSLAYMENFWPQKNKMATASIKLRFHNGSPQANGGPHGYATSIIYRRVYEYKSWLFFRLTAKSINNQYFNNGTCDYLSIHHLFTFVR